MKQLTALCLTLLLTALISCMEGPATGPGTYAPDRATPVTASNIDSVLSDDSTVAIVEFYSEKDQLSSSLAWVLDSISVTFGNAILVGANDADDDTLSDRFTVTEVPTYLLLRGETEIFRCSFPGNSPEVYDSLATLIRRLLNLPPVIAPVLLDSATFHDSVTTDGRIAMVEFFSPTCSHCIAMEPVVKQVAADLGEETLVAKVNAPINAALAASFNVSGWPTFIFFNNGVEYDRILGETTYARIVGKIKAGLDGIAD